MNVILTFLTILIIFMTFFPKLTYSIIFGVLLYIYLPPLAIEVIFYIALLSMLIPVAEPHR